MKRLNKWLDNWEGVIQENIVYQKEVRARKDTPPNGNLMFHSLALMELSGYIEKIRKAVDEEDIEKAVLWTADFVDRTNELENIIQSPAVEKKARSAASRKAVNVRHGKSWTPEKRKTLKIEYKKKIDAGASHYKACRELAESILDDKAKWRQIETQVKKE